MSHDLWVGSTGGNRHVTKLWVGTTGGNVQIKKLWVGDSGTNRLILSYAVSPPAVVNVATLGHNELRITWSTGEGATEYLIQRYDGGWVTVETSTGLLWDNSTGLNDGAEYEYRVISSDGSTQSAPSSAASGITTLKEPVMVRAERGPTPWSQGSIYYNDGGSVSESEIRIYSDDGGGYVLADTVAPNSTQQDIGGLAPATSYTIKLRNYNAVANESADSGTDSFDTAPGSPDWAATYPQDASTSDDEIKLKLLPEPGSTAYDVYYRINASMGGDPLGTGVNLGTLAPAQIVTAAYVHDTSQAHGTVMYYQCRSRDVVGPGNWSAEASATVVMRIPGPPANVVASYSTAAMLGSVKWTIGVPANEAGFRLQRAAKPFGGAYGAWGTEDIPGAGSTHSTGDVVTPGNFYKYQIRAENAGGNSSYAPSNEITVHDTPDIVTNVVLTLTGSTDYSSELVVKWTPGGGAVTYQEVEHKAAVDGWTGTPQSTGIAPASTSFTITALADDTLFQARVRGYNPVDGAGPWSSTAGSAHAQYTYPTMPNAPSWFGAYPEPKQATDDVLLIRWSHTASADEYDVHGSLSSGFSPSSTNRLTTVVATTYPDSGIAADTRKYYQLIARHIATASTHDAVSAASTEGYARTHINKPTYFSIHAMSTATGYIFMHWRNLNSTGDARIETMTIDRYTGAWGTVASTVFEGSTSYTDIGASTSVTKYRIKYNSESNWTEKPVPI